MRGGPVHELLARLRQATNDHDLEGIVACFTDDYRNETPIHPERGFTGRDQVRQNWTMILSMVPDVTTEVLQWSLDGDTLWSEWDHRGTRPDGSPHHMVGVVIFGLRDGLAASARFYLEPVQTGGPGPGQALAQHLGQGR
jgi:ketosteroid isomerase-like protein